MIEITPIVWIAFLVFVLLMLGLDLAVFHRKSHEVGIRESLIWTGVWIGLALLFNAGVYHWMGHEKGLEFLTGYLIEKALSVDNLFVFIMLFSMFQIEPKYQHKVLFWGILGALVMRAVFIFTGVALINRFHWIIYLFGAFLVFTGAKMIFQQHDEVHPEKNPLVRLFKKIFPVTHELHGDRFFVRINHRLFATPLFVVLIVVELTDLIFATDSIPAILAISHDPFIIFSSNVFAILGLRALYFALAGITRYFVYLRYGLAAILVFVGLKMSFSGYYHFPVGWSLLTILLLLLISIAASLIRKPKMTESKGK